MSDTTFTQHLRQLQYTVWGAATVGLLLLLLVAQLAWVGLQTYRHPWQAQTRQADTALQALSQVQQHLGFGGFMQHYQSLILTRNLPLYRPLVEQDLRAITAPLQQLDSLMTAAEDQQRLHTLRNAIQQHERRYRLTLDMLEQERSTDDIARITSVDDRPAQAALQRLLASAQAQKQAVADSAEQADTQLALWLSVAAFALAVGLLLATQVLLRRLRQLHQVGTALQAHSAGLAQARDQADTEHRAQANLLEAVTHELRTPINAIIGFAQLLETDGNLNYEQRDDVLQILKASHQVLMLMDALQEGTHPSGNGRPSQP